MAEDEVVEDEVAQEGVDDGEDAADVTDFSDNVIKISAQKRSGFYVRTGQNFLQGVKDKNGKEKPVFPSIVFSAIGPGILICTTVVDILVRRGIAEIKSIKTDYIQMDGGNSRKPQLRIEVAGKAQAPPTPERLLDAKMEKKMKKVVKEGGKRGVEIEGAASMGGLEYFCTLVNEPEGDVDLLVECMKAMNAPSDPSEEERKGGSGHIGKMIVSMKDKENDKLSICAYVPTSKQGKHNAEDWLKEVISMLDIKNPDLREDSNKTYAQIQLDKDVEKGVFPLKIRDNVTGYGLQILKKKGLFPDKDDEDDDEMVFGDEDFPE